MSIEEQVATLTDVVRQGFADLSAFVKQQVPVQQEQPAAMHSGRPNGGAAPEPEETGPSFAEVNAIAQKLAAVKGQAYAAKLIQKHGGGRLAQMPKAQYPAFIAACEVLLSEPSADL